MSDGDAGLSDLEPKRTPVSLRSRTFVLGGVIVVLAVAGIFTWRQVKPVVEARKYSSVTYQVPKAPKLTAEAGETVYRIDPTKSSLSYEVQETFAGKKTSKATGTSNGIAGDIAVNADDLSASRVGPVVASLEQLHSDNNLRDARLRADYLESNKYPLATFKTTEISGLSGKLTEGKDYPVTLTGDLTVKEQTKRATFDGTASLADGALTATVTAKAKLSDFGAGPIRIAGMVSTSNDALLTMELTAFDPTEHTIPTTITGPHAKEAKDAPSFAKTVQPILEANCASCHNTGQMGAHQLTIDTAGDAQAVSDGLKTVTAIKHMPPWPASDKGVPLLHKMSLTQAEIDAIGKWADAGGALDVPETTPIKPSKGAIGPVPRQDIVLDRPAYTGSVDNTNDYRCFVLDPKLTEPTYLTGYTFLSDQVEELHHAQVFHISGEQVQSSKAIDGKDGQPGWGCYSGPSLAGKRPDKVPGRARTRDAGFPGQSNLVAGWVPGQGPSVFTHDSGILMEPGDALVLQLHYHYSGTPTPDRSTLALQLDPAAKKKLRAIRVINPLGPVEIPCAPADQGQPLCNRDAAIADNVKLYGPSGAANERGLLLLCGQTPDKLTATFDGRVASSSCNQVVPEDGTIVSVLGHMHTLGKSIRLTLDPDTAKEKILLDVPDWSFDWQMNYELATPVHVTAGQPLRIDCSWDRGADPLRKPKYIVFAEGTEDEMCFGTYALIPDNQG
ncbi:YceI family protein [Aquihabitans sp. McL0605]|uniref:YceI family protein n=1 Tax=Aquihabitans sp. McL0605 TaxID=3415671 RepID=UPI003CF5BCC6